MNKSETIENLSAALVIAQAKMPAAPMNKENPFLKNNYADLGAIIETAQPILAANHLAVSQICTSRDGYIGVETVLLHKSGEWISAYMELPASDEKGKSNAQVAGSIITYIRRYSLAAILGMYADEDVDGNGAVKVNKSKVAEPMAKVKQCSKCGGALPKDNESGICAMCFSSSETIIPKSVVDGCKNSFDAYDKIEAYAMETKGKGPEVLDVLNKFVPKDYDGDINDVDEEIVIGIVEELTGRKFEVSG